MRTLYGLKILFVIAFTAAISRCAFSQPGEWTWMHGSSTVNGTANFGTQGVSSPTNEPPPFYEASDWTDAQGNFWLFGGYSSGMPSGFMGDMWKFDPSTNEWTWMHGTGIGGPLPVYGTQGMPAPANSPGGGHWCAATWVDNNGMFWLFGGNPGGTSTLWMYNPVTNEWTWMKGPTGNSTGVFGTQGVPDPSNHPPSRWETNATWVDASNNLWLFGGLGNNGDDLWKYSVSTNEWTWVRGAAGAVAPVYGTLNVGAPANTPGTRQVYSKWKDVNNDFWLFGGSGENNDLWKYTLSSNQWTWMGGTNVVNHPGTYTTPCVSSATDVPAARHENRACWIDANGNFWFFGGYDGQEWNDLWKYCPVSGKWTWINGSSQANGVSSHGTLGVSSPTNNPGARMGSTGWKDSSGNFWIFGGYIGIGPTGNDLWRFVPDPACGDNSCSTVPTALFTAPNHICPGTCTDFTNLSLGASSYQWSFAGASPSVSTDVSPMNICYSTPGTYAVELIATNATGSDTLLLNNYIIVYPAPPPQGITQSGDTLFANPGAVSYQWYYAGNLISGATDYFYVALQSGNYNVVATDANGCEVEAVIFDVTAGIGTLESGQFAVVYPNPVTDKLTIYDSQFNMEAAVIKIYNVLGELVQPPILNLSPIAVGTETTIEVSGLGPGVYWLEIQSGKKILHAKFMKE
jgi:hypothetical protein